MLCDTLHYMTCKTITKLVEIIELEMERIHSGQIFKDFFNQTQDGALSPEVDSRNVLPTVSSQR